MKCSGCSSEEWVQGRAEFSGKGGFQFRPDNSKFMVLSWPTIDARACRVCGNVVFAVEPEKLRSVMKD